MGNKLELTQAELQRLQRILACANLRRQRDLAVLLFVLSGLTLIGVPILSGLSPFGFLFGATLAMAAFFLGMARLGYYKLFRLIHHLAAQHDPQQVARPVSMRSPYRYACMAATLGCAILVLAILAALHTIRRDAQAKWTTAEDYLAAHSDVALEQAKSLVSMVGDGEAPFIRLSGPDVPVGLAVPQLKFAEVWPTHVNLILYTNPDVVSGFRVWASSVAAEYQDKPTAIPFVFRYRYCDDFPISAANRP